MRSRAGALLGHWSSVRRSLAEQAVTEVLSRYFVALDARDWERVRSCYAEGALEHRARYEGDVDGFIGYARGVLEK